VTQPVDEQLAVLGQVVAALRSLGVPHMVSGSIAASFYVEPRMTRDLDIVVDLTPDTAVGLAGLLAADFYCDETALVRAAQERTLTNAIHTETLLKVDLIVRKDDAFHREEFSRRVASRLGTVDVDLVTPEDLVVASDEALDTTPAVASELRRRLLARSGSERTVMAARMFHTAKALAESRARADGLVDAVEIRMAVLRHLYGDELSPATYCAVRARLAASDLRQASDLAALGEVGFTGTSTRS